jgi:hypothetical protein
MIEVAHKDGNIVSLTASGKLSRADYQRALIPRLESLIEKHGKLRVMFLLDETFRGWDLSAAWDNTCFDFRHRNDFEKVAVVGAPKWEEWCVKWLAYPLFKGELRTFRGRDLDAAWNWIRA